MVNRNRSNVFYLLLVVVASVMVGMVLASRLDLASQSSAQTLGVPAVNSAPITGPVSATTFREVAKLVNPAVVNIRSEALREVGGEDFFGLDPDDLSEFFGPRPRTPGGQGQAPRRQQPRERLVEGSGTGFIIDKSGLILTNNHVVEGATRIRVSLYNEDPDQFYDARVVGRDELTDSALLELTEKPGKELPTVKFGDSAQMMPGDWVMAIGNPFGQDHSVSVGVISATRGGSEGMQVAALRRADVLQTDAAINPGNSGGPLINLRGEVIGINTAIATTGLAQGNMGVGFAIPSNTVREILPQLRSGKVTRGRVGVQVQDVPRRASDELGLKEKAGAVVTSVEEAGPAAKAGIDEGDVILSWNNQAVKSSDELVRMVMTSKPNVAVPMRVLRDGKERSMSITVEELDLDAEDATRRRARAELTSLKPEEQKGFGMVLAPITTDVSRRLRLAEGQRGAYVEDVDQGSPAWEGRLRPDDVIFKVNRTPVATRDEALRELQKVPAGGTALVHVVKQDPNTSKGYREVFLMVTKD